MLRAACSTFTVSAELGADPDVLPADVAAGHHRYAIGRSSENRVPSIYPPKALYCVNGGASKARCAR